MAVTAPQATTCLTTPVCFSATAPATTRGCCIHRVPVCHMMPATTGMYSHDNVVSFYSVLFKSLMAMNVSHLAALKCIQSHVSALCVFSTCINGEMQCGTVPCPGEMDFPFKCFL